MENKNDFNKIEKVLNEIKNESMKFDLKYDLISRTASIIKEHQYRSSLFYKKVMTVAVVILVFFNIIQGVMLNKSKKQIALLNKTLLSQRSDIPKPESSVISQSRQVQIYKTNTKKVKQPDVINTEERKNQEFIYASTREISDLFQLYNLFSATFSPTINSIETNEKETGYEAI